ncbi:MAG: alpha/beta hydrolase [Rhodopirellula sp.]|nr:alpha/beta hydrolase [Rhodopirellula sp.]
MNTRYKTIGINDMKMFYREGGCRSCPTVVLLHGLPSSSHIFRDLIGKLEDRFHVLAPDYPGFGNSDCPDREKFEYTFDNVAKSVERFLDTLDVTRCSFYMHGAGLPIGLRIATRRPESVESLIVQNGNCYEEGFTKVWEPVFNFWKNRTDDTEQGVRRWFTRDWLMWHYQDGARDRERINPDTWNIDLAHWSRPGGDGILMDLLYDYRKNVELYPHWQTYLADHQPPTLVLWGRNDSIFSQEGALAYHRDLRDVELHLLDTGHFALEECCDEIAQHVRAFVDRVLTTVRTTAARVPVEASIASPAAGGRA